MSGRRALPEGEVTFVFTDVEGSTRLLERFPAEYGRLLARHHAILGEAVELNGGVVFETIGDAVYAAFADPVAAVRAAAGLQRGLAGEDWRPMDPVRVRVGIHTGSVERRGRHYFGPALYRCARLMATAHGGQVVLSQLTAHLVGDRVADEVELVDLGRHRLKDLQEPERVFQLIVSGLPNDFPALRSLGGRPNNLPAEVKLFVGREAELRRVTALLTADARVVTLTGVGGSGKTRLAVRAAEGLLEPFKDGVFFVDLAPLAGAELVAGRIAEVLRVPPTAGRPLLDSVITHLASLEVLLVLDNFEHLTGAAGDVAAIVAAAPRVRVLITSRLPLGIQGEHEVLVPPLLLPADHAGAEEILESPAVQLFVARARETRDDFEVGADAATIADICRRLDGLPLAIELAAARVRTLSPSFLLERLEGRLDLLTEGPVDLPARQRTLRDTLAWSYDLLDEPEQRALRNLGVFRGGCALAAAEAVVGAGALDRLDSLARHSLVAVRWDELGEPRYVLLETVGDFARERLAAAGEDGWAAHRHGTYFAEYAEQVGPRLFDDGRVSWLRRLADDRDNFRSALAWALASDEPQVGMRILASLWLWWWTVFREARIWAEQLLALQRTEDPTRALAGTAFVAEIAAAGEGDIAATKLYAELTVAICRQIGDDYWLALGQALGAGALAGYVRPGEAEDGDWSAAAAKLRTLCDEAIGVARASGNTWVEGWTTMISALMALLAGDPELARTWAEDGVGRLRALNDSWSAATGSTTLAFALIQLGELSAAEDALAGVTDALLDVGDLRIATNAEVAHGLVARFMGRPADAERHYAAALDLCVRSGDPANAPVCIEGIAAAVAATDPERSTRLLGAARFLYEAGNVPGIPGFEPMYDATRELLVGTLGRERIDRLLADGAAEAHELPLLELPADGARLTAAG